MALTQTKKRFKFLLKIALKHKKRKRKGIHLTSFPLSLCYVDIWEPPLHPLPAGTHSSATFPPPEAVSKQVSLLDGKSPPNSDFSGIQRNLRLYTLYEGEEPDMHPFPISELLLALASLCAHLLDHADLVAQPRSLSTVSPLSMTCCRAPRRGEEASGAIPFFLLTLCL
jgi:hypothetical protein